MSEPWLERWTEGRIGWHEAHGSEALRKYWRVSGRRVLVPLCGKTLDLVWLAENGNDVVGVELSEIAVEAFFAENRLGYTVEAAELPAYRATGLPITIYCGDYFSFDAAPFDAHFDRAALVALPAEMRPAYVEHTSALLEAGAEQLLITLEYEQDAVSGPPFAVPAEEVRGYWPHLARVAARDDLHNAPPKFRDAGLGEFTEVVWQTA